MALQGRREALIEASDGFRGHEVHDANLLDLGIISRDIVVTQRGHKQTLGDLAGTEVARGVILEKLVRVGMSSAIGNVILAVGAR